jgi:hypothetical protein
MPSDRSPRSDASSLKRVVQKLLPWRGPSSAAVPNLVIDQDYQASVESAVPQIVARSLSNIEPVSAKQDDAIVAVEPDIPPKYTKYVVPEPGINRPVFVDETAPHPAWLQNETPALSTGLPQDATRSSDGLAVPKGFDSAQTRKRYDAAAQKLKSCVKRRCKNWAAFDINFESLPTQDVATLQSEIEKVMEARAKSSQNKTAWSKSKAVMEQLFFALSPFATNLLNIGKLSSNVSV